MKENQFEKSMEHETENTIRGLGLRVSRVYRDFGFTGFIRFYRVHRVQDLGSIGFSVFTA